MTGDAVEQIKERLDIVELIGEQVPLRKAGRNFKGLCPFHQEKTPSFVVFPENQSFHCFGCGAGGDAFSFVMQQERVEFREALRILAERAGVQLDQSREPSRQETERESRLVELNRLAAEWFAHVLWNTRPGEPARALLARRGVDRTTAERFGLGFAPESWDALQQHLVKRGADLDEIVAAGLSSPRDGGGAYDRFRGRLMFPIRDRDGRTVGFGGRLLGDGQPKYLNSPQTPIFDKSALLYALDLAQPAIRRTREVVVVEGYMDAIAAHQFGFDNVVASMGTALTEAQARLVRRGVDRIILALDADAAGQMATLRGLDVLRDSLAEPAGLSVDPARMVRFERALKTDIRIARLPEGKDPDELIRRDPDAWRKAVVEPVPLLDFYVDAVIGPEPPTDPRRKSEAVERLRPVLREIGDRVVRAHYAREVARRLDVPETIILADERGDRRSAPRPIPTAPRARVQRVTTADPEHHLIALLLRHPLVVAPLIQDLSDGNLLDGRNRAILQAFRSTPSGEIETFTERLEAELADHARHLLELVPARPLGQLSQLRQESQQVIQRLRKARFDERIRQLRADIAEAQREGDEEALRLNMSLFSELMSRAHEFYPGKSPYFRDTRDAGV